MRPYKSFWHKIDKAEGKISTAFNLEMDEDIARELFSVETSQKRMNEIQKEPSYVPTVLFLCQNPSLSREQKLVAIDNLLSIVSELWRSQSSKIRRMIIAEIPEIIATSSEEYIGAVLSISDFLVPNAYLSGEWPEFHSVIQCLLSSDSAHIRSGLILSISFAQNMKNPNIEQESALNSLSTIFFSSISFFLPSCEQFSVLTFAYEAASLLSQNVSFDAIDPLLPIKASEILLNPLPTAGFDLFAVTALQFLSSFITRFNSSIPEEFLNKQILVLKSIFETDSLKAVKIQALCMLSSLIFDAKRMDLLEENAQYFICVLFPSLMQFSDSKFRQIEDHPYGFVSSMNMLGVSRVKSYTLSILQQSAKLSKVVAAKCIEYALVVFSLFNRISRPSRYERLTLLSTAYMLSACQCSCVMPKELLSMSLSYISSDNFIVRAAGFISISEIPSAQISAISFCISSLEDDYWVVRYYSALALAHFLSMPSDIDEVRNQIDPLAQTIFTEMFSIAVDFHDKFILGSLSSIIAMLGSQFNQFLVDFCLELMSIFSECSEAGLKVENFTMARNVYCFVRLVGISQNTSDKVLPPLYRKITEILQKTEASIGGPELLIIAANIIKLTPTFRSEFWDITEVVQRFLPRQNYKLLPYVSPVYKNLIFKDNELKNRQEVLDELMDLLQRSLGSDYEWSIASSIMVSFLLKIESRPLIIERLPEIVQMMGTSQKSTNLFGALLYVFGESVVPLFGASFSKMLGDLIESADYPFVPVIATRERGLFDGDQTQYAKILASAFDAIVWSLNYAERFEDVELESSDSEDEESEGKQVGTIEIDVPEWFSALDVANDFRSLIEEISRQNDDLYRQFLANLPRNLLKCFQNYDSIIEKLSAKKYRLM